eukprot:gene10950-biopygen7944
MSSTMSPFAKCPSAVALLVLVLLALLVKVKAIVCPIVGYDGVKLKLAGEALPNTTAVEVEAEAEEDAGASCVTRK